MQALATHIANGLLATDGVTLTEEQLALLKSVAELDGFSVAFMGALIEAAARPVPDNSWALRTATPIEHLRYFGELRRLNGPRMYLAYEHADLAGADETRYIVLRTERRPLTLVATRTRADQLVDELAKRIADIITSDAPTEGALTDAEYRLLTDQVRGLSFTPQFIAALEFAGSSHMIVCSSWHLRVASTEVRNSNENYPVRPRGPAEYFVRTASSIRGLVLKEHLIVAAARTPVIVGKRWRWSATCANCDTSKPASVVGVRHANGSLDLYCSEACATRHACPLIAS